MRAPLQSRDLLSPESLDIIRKDTAFRISQGYPYSPAAVYDVLLVCADNETHTHAILSVCSSTHALGPVLDVLDPERNIRDRRSR
jgi:hypothetical protein